MLCSSTRLAKMIEKESGGGENSGKRKLELERKEDYEGEDAVWR